MDNQETMTCSEVGKRLGVGVNYVFMLLSVGKLKGAKNGRKWRVFKESVEDYARERESRALQTLAVIRAHKGKE